MKPLCFNNITFKIATKPPCTFNHNFYMMYGLNGGCIWGFDFFSKYKMALFPSIRSLGYSTQGVLTVLKINALTIKSMMINKEPFKINVPDKHTEKAMFLIHNHPNVYELNLQTLDAQLAQDILGIDPG
jgi:hypothetical protein